MVGVVGNMVGKLVMRSEQTVLRRGLTTAIIPYNGYENSERKMALNKVGW